MSVVATSAAGHVVGGGAVLWSPVLAGLVAVLAAVSVSLSRVRWTVARLVPTLVIGQAVLHVVFMGAPQGGGAPGMGMSAGMTATSAPAVTLPMVAGHLAAACLLALLLARAENWLWQLAAALGFRAFPAPLRLVFGSLRPQEAFLDRDLPVLRRLMLVRDCARRGPPARTL